ncbi:hypothetical protein GCM10023323_18570 [Streptomyces thinghirensis]|uniref:Uncharacterized protein n=1 Tax=Streptomyces thinghirensis TaxID=551547 RepID=A0ABP9T1P6_9ACTN
MREDVGTAAVLRDEAEALFRVEPLDGSAGHAFAFQPISDPHRANPEVVVLVLRHCTANRPHSGAGGLGEPRHLLLTLHGMSEPHQ